MEQSKNMKKKVGIIVGIIIVIGILVLVQQLYFKAPSFESEMRKAAIEMNKTYPMMVDQHTRLDNAAVLPNNEFQYSYTLVYMVKDSLNLQAFEDYMKPAILNGVRTNPDLKAYRNNKVTMSYNYKDKNGVFITKISVKAEQYLE
jgi:hypothetical protein